MIIRAYCCCPESLGPPIDDGKDEISVSHSYCYNCAAAAMANIESHFAVMAENREAV